MCYRGELSSGKDRQAPIDEMILPWSSEGLFPADSWKETGLTWADIIKQEEQNGKSVHSSR